MKEIRGTRLLFGIEMDVSATPLADTCQNTSIFVLIAGKGNVVKLALPLIILEQ